MKSEAFESILSAPRRPKTFELVYRAPLFNARKIRLLCGHSRDKWIVNRIYRHGFVFECPDCRATWDVRQ
jgi:hypothetical protein